MVASEARVEMHCRCRGCAAPVDVELAVAARLLQSCHSEPPPARGVAAMRCLLRVATLVVCRDDRRRVRRATRARRRGAALDAGAERHYANPTIGPILTGLFRWFQRALDVPNVTPTARSIFRMLSSLSFTGSSHCPRFFVTQFPICLSSAG